MVEGFPDADCAMDYYDSFGQARPRLMTVDQETLTVFSLAQRQPVNVPAM